MSDTPDCQVFADWLARQAALGGLAGTLVIAALPLIAIVFGGAGNIVPGGLLLIASAFAAVVALALSALLRFDAALFQTMAGRDEQEAGRDIDRLLAAMRLKPLPAVTRPLADRMRGARRLVAWQRVALALSLALAVLAAAMLGG